MTSDVLNDILLLVLIGMSAWLLTAGLRFYARHRRILDVPNARSSHHVATPRGGGAAIVVVAGVGMYLTGVNGFVVSGGLMVGLIGFVDDHRHVPAAIRLLIHAAGATMAVIGLGGFAGAWVLLAVAFVAWQINLTNFMDGIDGIAGVQVISVCVAGALLAAMHPQGTVLTQSAWLVAAATSGFLLWNWPPARIFMGDVGSGFVGYMLGVLTLMAAQLRPELGWAWIILSAVFIADTGLTLVRRALRREAVHEAHRSHAYQHLTVRLGAHRPVTLGVLAINMFVLAPLAWLVATRTIPAAAGLAAAYVPLFTLCFGLGAGVPSPTKAAPSR